MFEMPDLIYRPVQLKQSPVAPGHPYYAGMIFKNGCMKIRFQAAGFRRIMPDIFKNAVRQVKMN